MLKDRFKPWDGLRKYGQGIQKHLKISKNDENFGLGYKFTRINKMKLANEKKEKMMACLESWELRDEGIIIIDIKQSFQSVGFTFPNQIGMSLSSLLS